MILIINCGSQKTPYIEDSVNLVDDYKTIELFSIPDVNLNEFEGIIISGAPILITEVDTKIYVDLFSWINNHEKPILGICFGHQMIGLLHGAQASRQKEDRDWQTIESLEDSELFDRLPREFSMMEDHCECISIPKGFKLIATSDACVNEAMQHETKKIYGVQFHPEVSGNQGDILIENFINTCINTNSNIL
jgi:GMP synthase (glutamine-hydrolysing)